MIHNDVHVTSGTVIDCLFFYCRATHYVTNGAERYPHIRHSPALFATDMYDDAGWEW